MLNVAETEPEPEWRTGTAIDEFTPIYLSLAKGTRLGRFTPGEVDAMDITTVATMMGVGADPGAAEMAELADLARRRAAGEDVSWDTMAG